MEPKKIPDPILVVERPVAGGRMLARDGGRIVLVGGALPGERVRVTIDRVARGVAFATVREVLEPSSSRREPAADPLCGGNVFAHVRADAQPPLKAAMLRDALRHGARLEWPSDVHVHASPERGYRMRARLHVRNGRAGFFREGSHELCPAGRPGHLSEDAVRSIEQFVGDLSRRVLDALDAVEFAENVEGTERVLHLIWRPEARVPDPSRVGTFTIDGVTGVSGPEPRTGATIALAGSPVVGDQLNRLVPDAAIAPELRVERHAQSFFQANRFLLPTLVESVTRQIGDGPVVDLYAGVGLFAVALAARGHEAVTAVESHNLSAGDLARNAAPFDPSLVVEATSVEEFLGRHAAGAFGTILVDPPRTGMSRAAIDGVLRLRARRLVYVSCDLATFARDLRRCIDAGYALSHLEAFDLFPNTAHVEALGVLDIPA